jgi:hypothetical protein
MLEVTVNESVVVVSPEEVPLEVEFDVHLLVDVSNVLLIGCSPRIEMTAVLCAPPRAVRRRSRPAGRDEVRAACSQTCRTGE